MNILLLLAGGSGTRSGADTPKQFIEISGIPIIVHTLKTFQELDVINQICVVSHSEYINEVWAYGGKYGITKIKWVVDGGNSGLASVKRGLDIIECDHDDIILIHDAVRPFISDKDIINNIEVAKRKGNAVTVVPCLETLISVDNSGQSISQTPRDGLMRVMTPQSFRYSILRELFDHSDIWNSPYPSTFALYMSKGHSVYTSSGSQLNIKITYPEDLEMARLLNSTPL